MSSPVIIGQRIKSLREELGLSREQFSNEVGITLSAVSMYENGQRIPRDEIKVKIARVLKTSIEALFLPSRFTNRESVTQANTNIMRRR